LTQTDRVVRLIPPPGSGFGNVFPATIKSVTINGVPALDDESVCMCAWAGVITVTDPGQVRVTTE